jgi:protein-disulfide isomerase
MSGKNVENPKENLSKRQARKEEIRRKERQQRLIVIAVVVVVFIVILGAIVVPLVKSYTNPASDVIRGTPVPISNANGTAIGDPNAPVKIDVFEDFACSACQVYNVKVEPSVLTDIVDKGGVYYVFHNFPFLDDRSTDKRSHRAASAAECANEQGRFWDYKQLLFLNQGNEAINGEFNAERLAKYAQALNLDMAKFNACVQANPYQSVIDADKKLGETMNINGTPSIFVNGQEVAPGKVPTMQDMLKAVQAAAAGQPVSPAPTPTP